MMASKGQAYHLTIYEAIMPNELRLHCKNSYDLWLKTILSHAVRCIRSKKREIVLYNCPCIQKINWFIVYNIFSLSP